MTARRAGLAALLLAGASACGGPGRGTRPAPHAAAPRRARHAAVVVLEREGSSPVVAVEASVGALDERDTSDAARLLGLVWAERLRARGVDATVRPSLHGVVARVDVATPEAARAAVRTLLGELARTPTSHDVARAARAAAGSGLTERPTPADLADAACRGVLAAASPSSWTEARARAWHGAATSADRVAVAAVAPSAVAHAVEDEVAVRVALSEAPLPDAPRAATDDVLVEARPAAAAEVRVRADLADAASAARFARALGSGATATRARLRARAPDVTLVDVTATAVPKGGCVTARFATPAGLGPEELVERAAQVAAIVGEDVEDDDDARRPSPTPLARTEVDARRAAELVVRERLASTRARTTPPRPRTSVVLLVPLDRDALPPERGGAAPGALAATLGARVAALRAETGQARVEHVTALELGQPEPFVLVGSPCGTRGEEHALAGASAAFALAAAARGADGADGDLALAPVIGPDVVGVVAHGPRRAGEGPIAHARRVARAAARAFALAPLTNEDLAAARARLLVEARAPEHAALDALARALVPRGPTTLVPEGTRRGADLLTDGAVVARAEALRRGPLRVAVLAPAREAATQAEVEATRWLEGRARATCAELPPLEPRAGLVTVPLGERGPAIVVALPLTPDDEPVASALEALFDGPNGLLDEATRGIARASSARLLGPPGARVLALRIEAPDGAVDAAAAQVRGLLASAATRGLGAARTRALALRLDARRREASHDGAARALARFREPDARAAPARLPSDAALSAALARVAREDNALVVVERGPRAEVSR